MSKKSSAWITATAIGVVLILALAWFGAASGQFADAALAREQAEQVEAQNQVLQSRVTVLRDQYASLDEVRSEIDQLRVGIPTSAQTAELLRQIEDVARASNVLVGAVSPGDVAVIAAGADAEATVAGPPEDPDAAAETPAPASAEATPAPEATPVESGSEPTAPVAVDGQAAEAGDGLVPDGFAAVPVSVTAYGWARDASAFVTALQNDVPRLILVTGATMTTVTEVKAPSNGVPELQPGMVELTVQMQAYVLEDRLASDQHPQVPADGPQLSDVPAGKEPWLMPPANRATDELSW